jgi:hypothetical protein
LAASGMKAIFSDHWNKIPVEEKMAIKDYLLNYLATNAFQSDRQVMKMMIILLAKISKLAWFDHPELKTMVTEITQLFNVYLYWLVINII